MSAEREWKPFKMPKWNETNLGILFLKRIGDSVGIRLRHHGFEVETIMDGIIKQEMPDRMVRLRATLGDLANNLQAAGACGILDKEFQVQPAEPPASRSEVRKEVRRILAQAAHRQKTEEELREMTERSRRELAEMATRTALKTHPKDGDQ